MSSILSLLFNMLLIDIIIRPQIAFLAQTVRVIWLKNVATGVRKVCKLLRFLTVWLVFVFGLWPWNNLRIFLVFRPAVELINIKLLFLDIGNDTFQYSFAQLVSGLGRSRRYKFFQETLNLLPGLWHVCGFDVRGHRLIL